jgi:hypothetical protein
LLPATLEGIILKYEEPSKVDGIPLWSSFPFLRKFCLDSSISQFQPRRCQQEELKEKIWLKIKV